MTRLGFIGLGNMGLPMMRRLIAAGHTVTVFDLNPAALEAARSAGASIADDLATCAQDAECVFTMLQTSQQVHSVCLGDDGVYANATQPFLHIDCSSIDVKDAKALHQSAKEMGITHIDAPVSGGVTGATTGALTIMVGGNDAALAQAKPFLECIGKNIIHAGGAGAGQVAKTCNNMVLGVSMIAISEAFKIAEALGVEAQTLFDIMSKASGQCWALSHYCPVPGIMDNVPANNDYQPGFSAAMMLKDLNLSQTAADLAHIDTRLGQAARDFYQQFVDAGHADMDFSGVITDIKS